MVFPLLSPVSLILNVKTREEQLGKRLPGDPLGLAHSKHLLSSCSEALGHTVLVPLTTNLLTSRDEMRGARLGQVFAAWDVLTYQSAWFESGSC